MSSETSSDNNDSTDEKSSDTDDSEVSISSTEKRRIELRGKKRLSKADLSNAINDSQFLSESDDESTPRTSKKGKSLKRKAAAEKNTTRKKITKFLDESNSDEELNTKCKEKKCREHQCRTPLDRSRRRTLWPKYKSFVQK